MEKIKLTKDQLIKEWNNTPLPHTKNSRLDQLREFVAKFTPDLKELIEIKNWSPIRSESESYQDYRTRRTFQYQLEKYLD